MRVGDVIVLPDRRLRLLAVVKDGGAARYRFQRMENLRVRETFTWVELRLLCGATSGKRLRRKR